MDCLANSPQDIAAGMDEFARNPATFPIDTLVSLEWCVLDGPCDPNNSGVEEASEA